MEPVEPAQRTTVKIDDHTWRAESAGALRDECAHLLTYAMRVASSNPTVLYRGHSDSAWALNSTFGRWARERFDTSTNESYFELSELFLRHFGQTYGPSAELAQVAAANPGLDAWFELMKRIQQHNEDGEFEGINAVGTNLMDWSMNIDVAFSFAGRNPTIDGAVYLFDAQAAGAILIERPYREVLDAWVASVDAGEMRGNPLLFCPRRQLADARASRQAARYLAQIDLRVPVDVIWTKREAEHSEVGHVWHRMLISPAVKADLRRELIQRGFDYESLMA